MSDNASRPTMSSGEIQSLKEEVMLVSQAIWMKLHTIATRNEDILPFGSFRVQDYWAKYGNPDQQRDEPLNKVAEIVSDTHNDINWDEVNRLWSQIDFDTVNKVHISDNSKRFQVVMEDGSTWDQKIAEDCMKVAITWNIIWGEFWSACGVFLSPDHISQVVRPPPLCWVDDLLFAVAMSKIMGYPDDSAETSESIQPSSTVPASAGSGAKTENSVSLTV